MAILALAIVAVLVVAGLFASGIMGAARQPGTEDLGLELPAGLHISSYTVYRDTLVLLCWKDVVAQSSQFFLLTYRLGDKAFENHSLGSAPYSGSTTSLHVVDDRLYLFYVQARGGEYTSYRSVLEEVNTKDWTTGASRILALPSLLDPGYRISDGHHIYVIGGMTANTTPPMYWPSERNDTIFKVDVTSRQAEVVAVVPGAGGMQARFVGEKLLLARVGSNAGTQFNYGGAVDWNSSFLLDPSTGEMTAPADHDPLPATGDMPVSIGDSIYYFNPLIERFVNGSFEWNYTREIWEMDTAGKVRIVNLTLPEGIKAVTPIRLGQGFVLIEIVAMPHSYTLGAKFWYCYIGDR